MCAHTTINVVIKKKTWSQSWDVPNWSHSFHPLHKCNGKVTLFKLAANTHQLVFVCTQWVEVFEPLWDYLWDTVETWSWKCAAVTVKLSPVIRHLQWPEKSRNRQSFLTLSWEKNNAAHLNWFGRISVQYINWTQYFLFYLRLSFMRTSKNW